MKQTLLIDGNSVGYGAHHATKLTVGRMQVQAVYGFVKSLRTLANKFTNSKFVVLWDGRAQWRYDLYPGYKGNRNSDDPIKIADKAAYKSQVPAIQKLVSSLGITQILPELNEADDFAGILSKKLPGYITLVSGDQDWLQLVNDRVSWFDPIRDIDVNTNSFLKFTGYTTPAEFLEGKILQGDTSDTITGVGGIGKDGAPLFVAQFKSIAEFHRQCDSGEFKPTKKAHLSLWKGTSELNQDDWLAANPCPTPDDPKLLKKHLKQYSGQGRLLEVRNRKLMDLSAVPPIDRSTWVNHPGEYNPTRFKALCERLNFQSVLRELDTYTNHFKKEAP